MGCTKSAVVVPQSRLPKEPQTVRDYFSFQYTFCFPAQQKRALPPASPPQESPTLGLSRLPALCVLADRGTGPNNPSLSPPAPPAENQRQPPVPDDQRLSSQPEKLKDKKVDPPPGSVDGGTEKRGEAIRGAKNDETPVDSSLKVAHSSKSGSYSPQLYSPISKPFRRIGENMIMLPSRAKSNFRENPVATKKKLQGIPQKNSIDNQWPLKTINSPLVSTLFKSSNKEDQRKETIKQLKKVSLRQESTFSAKCGRAMPTRVNTGYSPRTPQKALRFGEGNLLKKLRQTDLSDGLKQDSFVKTPNIGELDISRQSQISCRNANPRSCSKNNSPITKFRKLGQDPRLNRSTMEAAPKLVEAQTRAMQKAGLNVRIPFPLDNTPQERTNHNSNRRENERTEGTDIAPLGGEFIITPLNRISDFRLQISALSEASLSSSSSSSLNN